MLKDFKNEVVAKAKEAKATQSVVRIGHKLEHPAHLVYFFAIASHLDYAIVAVVCLVVGVIAWIPLSVFDAASLADEAEGGE